jgi:ribonuclease P protein component
LIDGLFREGKSFALFPFRVFYSPLAPEKQSPPTPGKEEMGVRLQAGFGASSRNFKKSVDRNRIKRLTREAYRLQKGLLQERLEEMNGSLAVFFIYTGKEVPEQETVTKKMGLILQKLVKETGG